MKSKITVFLMIVALAAGGIGLAGAGMAKGPTELNDLEIAHVAYTAGNIDIRYAHLALALSDNPEVRAFAQTMIRDHSAVNERAVALVTKLNVTPVDNDVSRELVRQSEALIAELRTLDGAAFDRRYASNELGYHQFVNGAVSDIFIPNAQNEELKALLTAALKIFRVHEGHAEKMVQALN